MMDLTQLTLTQARAALLTKQCSAAELTQAFIGQMEKHRDLNAYITQTPDHALEQARAADKRLTSGEAGLMEGLPIGMKDLFCSKGIRTTAGSLMLENFVPSYESTVSHNLLSHGAVVLGKTNMDEFAMGSANITSAYGPSISPWKRSDNPAKQIIPGGSSGGSSAAVAARMCLAATGSDTGGSIRQPASFCGLVGMKPTYGLCSRWGMVAFASSLDQAGPLTHTVADAALMLQAMAGYDAKDATCINVPIPDYVKNLNVGAVKGMRIGVALEYIDRLNDEMKALFNQGVDWLRSAGATIHEVSLSTTPYALPTYYIIAPAEASSNLARYDGVRYGHRTSRTGSINTLYEYSRREGFGDEVRRRIMIGTYVLSAGYYDAYYTRAQKVRRLIKADFDNAFESVDLILTPTTPTEAFALDERPTDPIEMYLNDIFTVTVNLAGLPAISVPAGLSGRGLPLGLQLIGPKFSEQTLFNAAKALEDCANFKEKVPSHDA
jgi:aspartyl-tRNA(Asn)/glutamyl-tRNA(Gln) amidotransferase subunit A